MRVDIAKYVPVIKPKITKNNDKLNNNKITGSISRISYIHVYSKMLIFETERCFLQL